MVQYSLLMVLFWACMPKEFTSEDFEKSVRLWKDEIEDDTKTYRNHLLKQMVEHCLAQPNPNQESAMLAHQLFYRVRDHLAG